MATNMRQGIIEGEQRTHEALLRWLPCWTHATRVCVFFFQYHFKIFQYFTRAQTQHPCGFQEALVTNDVRYGTHVYADRCLDMSDSRPFGRRRCADRYLDM